MFSGICIDAGHAVGALLTGVIADFFGMEASVIFIAVLTFISAMIIHQQMYYCDLNGIKFFDIFFHSHARKRKAFV